jgi:hypothetical protein
MSEVISNLVDLFNEQELILLDKLTPKEYSCHLLVHLLDNMDVVNSKYLYKRAPEVVFKRSKSFS